jgi:4-amino-4-deoxy-L-arabinose transferase-like glycosyltransferase
MKSFLSNIVRYFGKWRLAFIVLLIAYATLLSLQLDDASIQWDEAPHLIGGLLINRVQIQEYTQQYLFYPPLFDATIALSYMVLGSSVFSARVVAVFFAIFSIGATFEIVYRLHGPRNALFSGILLASMPGFIVLSRMALIETMLLFFFSTSLFLFFLWMHTKNNKLLLLSGITIVLGFVVKYQILIAGIVMLVSLFLMPNSIIVKEIRRVLFMAIIAGAIIITLFLFLCTDAFAILEDWLYAIQVGNEERSVYSERFPLPVFYLIEMTYPYSHMHPISLPLYFLGLCGVAFWLWRRRNEDKFFLIWFSVVYSTFTLIPNRNWRYALSLFPLLAISASDFILSIWDKMKWGLLGYKKSLHKTVTTKIFAIVITVLVGASIVYSWTDAYSWIEHEDIYIPTNRATQYVIENSASNNTAVVFFPVNHFSVVMVKFYFSIQSSDKRNIGEYPAGRAVDAYRPVLNETFLIKYCKATNVKYLLLYEYGNMTYFDSEWTSHYVLNRLIDSGKFISEAVVGTSPRRIFIVRFISSS